MTNFIHEGHINHDLCDRIVEFHKSSDKKVKGSITSYDGEVAVDLKTKDSMDVALDLNKKLYNEYRFQLNKVIKDYILKFPSCNFYAPFGLSECINIQHYEKNGGYKIWHTERLSNYYPSASRHLVFMTYLNDVVDGGGTEFLNQNLIVQAKKGRTLIWPADWTHTHRGIVSHSQEKYIVTGWLNYLDEKNANLSIS